VRKKVYLRYAEQFLDPNQIDTVEESAIPASGPDRRLGEVQGAAPAGSFFDCWEARDKMLRRNFNEFFVVSQFFQRHLRALPMLIFAQASPACAPG